MSDPAPEAETTNTPAAPTTFAQKLGCSVMVLVAIAFGLVWWAMGDNAERWATSEVAAMGMSWPDQVNALKGLGEPQRSEAARRLVDAWMLQPDESSEWRTIAKPSTKEKIRDLAVSMLVAQADKPAQQARAKEAAKEARKAAAGKYAMFTPPPVDDHLAKGGEVWGRLAPADQSVSGGGVREFWLLSADRKHMEALVTMSAVSDATRYGTHSWYELTPLGKQSHKPATEPSTLEITPSVSASGAALNYFSIETQDAPDGPLRTQYSANVTLDFPQSTGDRVAKGSSGSVVLILQNGKRLGEPKQTDRVETFHRIVKANPPPK